MGAAGFVKDKGLTDLFVMSHGWNNDMDEARTLYANFFAAVRRVYDGGASSKLKGRNFELLAVLWPSKKFAEKDLIPSGAAGAAAGRKPADVRAHLDTLAGFFDGPGADQALKDARELVEKLDDSIEAQRKFADLVRSALPKPGPDPEGATGRLASKDGATLMKQLKDPVIVTAPKPTGATAGLIGDVVGKVGGAIHSATTVVVDAGRSAVDAAERLLNFATYYQMKERAGIVGRGGAYHVLRAVRDANPGVKIHLIGHSFGGRLVTAVALGPDGGTPIKPESMTLLQAAFSHYGFGVPKGDAPEGFFRGVVSKHQLDGPVLVTHTANDRAVGIAYALASRIAGQAGAGLGDASDLYGDIGRNGAQNTPEAEFLTLGGVGSTYQFASGKLFNLHADVITGHSDICKDEVASALLSAVAMT